MPTKQDLIIALIDHDIVPCYGLGQYPVSVSYPEDKKWFIEDFRDLINTISIKEYLEGLKACGLVKG